MSYVLKFCVPKFLTKWQIQTLQTQISLIYIYGKCPKILCTKISDKMANANIADPDQSAPEGADWSRSTLFAILLSILRKNIKSKI